MKRILFITPSPPNHLNRIRFLNILKAFQGQASVHLVCLSHDAEDDAYIERYRHLYDEVTVFHQSVRKSYAQALAGMLLGRSLRFRYCYNPDMHRFCAGLDIGAYDIVYATTLRMSQYADHFPPEMVRVDPCDSMTLYYDRISRTDLPLREKVIALYERSRIRREEKRVLRRYRTIYCSRVDAAYARALAPDSTKPSTVIPNVVDLNDFPLFERADHSRFTLCYWGMLKAPFNYTAVEILVNRIVPRLDAAAAPVRLVIIGPYPPKALVKHASGSVRFTGYVPDLVAALSHTDLFVCPLIAGAGVKNKILQSLACGLPVLTTSIGAEGIDGIEDLQARNMLVVEDDLGRFPERIAEFSSGARVVDHRAMREFVETHYSIEALREQLAAVVLADAVEGIPSGDDRPAAGSR